MSNSSSKKILLINSFAIEAARLKEVFTSIGYEVQIVENGLKALEVLQNTTPDLILIDGILSGLDITSFCREKKSNENIAHIPIVILVSSSEVDYKTRAISSGIDGYLNKPIENNDLIKQIAELLGDNVTDSKENEDFKKNKRAFIVTITSSKGGTGVSTIAANWGYTLSELFNKKTLLIDAAGYTNNLCTLLSTRNSSTLADICRMGDELDISALKSAVAKPKFNLDVISLLSKISDLNTIKLSILEQAINYFSTEYDFILIDTKAGIIDETSMFLLQCSDDLQIVTTYDPLAMKDSKAFIHALREFGVSENKIKLTLNRADCEIGNLDPNMIHQNLSYSVFCTLPNDWKSCIEATNAEKTVVEKNPKSKFAIELQVLASYYAKEQESSVQGVKT